MIDAESDALLADLARSLVARDRELRAALVEMNPASDHRWEPLFKALVAVDDDLRSMRGQVRR